MTNRFWLVSGANNVAYDRSTPLSFEVIEYTRIVGETGDAQEHRLVNEWQGEVRDAQFDRLRDAFAQQYGKDIWWLYFDSPCRVRKHLREIGYENHVQKVQRYVP